MSKYGAVPLLKEEDSGEYGFCDVRDPYPSVSYVPGVIDGKALFQQKCLSCHSIFKDMTGPALLAVSYNPFWSDPRKLAGYLRNPDSFTKYGYIKELRKKFGSRHIAFPELKDDEVIAILDYISSNERAVAVTDIADQW